MVNYSSIFPVSSGGGGSIAGFEWAEKTADFTAEANKAYYVDTALGNVLMTLPSNPSPGDEVAFLLIGSGKVNITTTDNVKGAALATDFVKQTGQQYLLFVLFYVDVTTGWNWDARYDSYIGNAYVGAGDPLSASVILFLQGNGANNSTIISDGSFSPKSITRYGDTKISTAQSKYGGSSLLFDGTGDYVTASLGSDAFNIRTSPYTIELWFYPLATTTHTFIASDGTGGDFYWQMLNGTWYLGDGVTNNISVAESPFSFNQWRHYALSFDLTTYRLFIGGVLRASSTTLLKSFSLSSVRIGQRGTNHPSNGYKDSIRITKTCRYTANFDLEVAPYLNE